MATAPLKLLYKYRSVAGENLNFVRDIFAQQRLYACSYGEFTDKNEGEHYYPPRRSKYYDDVLRQLAQLKVLSVAVRPNSYEHWRDYADEGRGICIAVTIKPSFIPCGNLLEVSELMKKFPDVEAADYDQRMPYEGPYQVRYYDGKPIDLSKLEEKLDQLKRMCDNPDKYNEIFAKCAYAAAQEVLIRKRLGMNHEQEERVMTKHSNHVSVNIEQVIFGDKMSEESKCAVQDMVDKLSLATGRPVATRVRDRDEKAVFSDDTKVMSALDNAHVIEHILS